MPEAELIETFQRLAMALGIGFLVGVERGWRHRDAPEGTRAAGLRTHAVIGLLGGISGLLTPTVGAGGFAAITIAFAAAFLVFKLRESFLDNDISVTGAIAGLLVYALGVYAMQGDLRIAAAVGVTLVALLAFKDALHNWLDRLTWAELRSALLILGATFVALPLLPDRPVDPWGVINPRELWLLTILVAGASFVGYAAVRILGAGVGLTAGAAVGALVSSTIVTAELGRRVRSGQTSAAAAASGAVLAAAVSVSRVGVFVSAAAPAALPQIGPALAVAALVFAIGAWLLNKLAHDGGNADPAHGLHSPLDLGSVLRFAAFLGVVTIVGRMIADAFGQAGLLTFAAAAGAADVDAVALAAGSLVRRGLDPAIGGHAMLVAVLVNTFSKAAIGAVAGGMRYAALYAAVAAASALAGAATWLFATPWLAPMFSSGPSLPGPSFG